MVVVMQPSVQIILQRVNAVVELFAECDLIELLQDRLVEPLADAVGLRRLHFGFRVVNVVDRQEELEVVLVYAPTIFRAAIRHDPQHWQVVVFLGSMVWLAPPSNRTTAPPQGQHRPQSNLKKVLS